MLQKITDNDEQWEKAKEEVTQVVAQHSDTQARLREQEQLTFMEEQRARVSDIMCTCRLYPAWLTVCKRAAEIPKCSLQCCPLLLLCSTERDGKPYGRAGRAGNHRAAA